MHQLPQHTGECRERCLFLAWPHLTAYLEKDLLVQVILFSSIVTHVHYIYCIILIAIVNESYGDSVSNQGVAQHLEVKSSSRPASPFALHQNSSVVVQSNQPTHVVVLQPTQLTHGN